jgi:formylglycine-generating enzyme required for sulfatase activity
VRSTLIVICAFSLLQAGAPRAMEFISVPTGEFIMGCSTGDNECRNNEKPAHRVRIEKRFYMQKYEVTQAQWADVMGSNPSEHQGADLPVQNVSWNDIEEFLAKLNARGDGFYYRLPTEAEWEYSARAGNSAPYSGPIDAIAWYDKNSGRRPHAVGSKQPNAWGIHDMSGNVWEWVADWFDADYYASSPSTDPDGPSSGRQHVVRGGSYSDNAAFARVSNRFGVTPSFGNYDLGFRLVRKPTESSTLSSKWRLPIGIPWCEQKASGNRQVEIKGARG